jgi:hypothetical protein
MSVLVRWALVGILNAVVVVVLYIVSIILVDAAPWYVTLPALGIAWSVTIFSTLRQGDRLLRDAEAAGEA